MATEDWIDNRHKLYRGIAVFLVGLTTAVAHMDLTPVLSWGVPLVLAGGVAVFAELAGQTYQKALAARVRRARIERDQARITGENGQTTP